MEPVGGWSEHDVTSVQNCKIESHADDILKPLVRRRLQHQRDLAHSLVGTPNYIAPEVLARTGTYLLSVSPVALLAHSLVGTPNYIAPEVLARSGTYLLSVSPVALLSSVARRHT